MPVRCAAIMIDTSIGLVMCACSDIVVMDTVHHRRVSDSSIGAIYINCSAVVDLIYRVFNVIVGNFSIDQALVRDRIRTGIEAPSCSDS